MLLGALVPYFAGGYSGLQLPFAVTPLVTTYLSPLLLLSGLAQSLFGLALQHKS